MGTVSAAGEPAYRLRKVDSFCGFKTKKITAGKLMLSWSTIGCLLEWASLPGRESGSLLMMIRGFWQQSQRDSVRFIVDFGSGLHFCGLGVRPPSCGLGEVLTSRLTLQSKFPSRYLCRRDPVILGLFGKFLDTTETHTECQPGY